MLMLPHLLAPLLDDRTQANSCTRAGLTGWKGPDPRAARNHSVDMYFKDAHEELRLHIRRFLEREVAPHLEEWEETTFPDSIVKRFGELGFLGLRYPPEYGGQGGDYFSAGGVSGGVGRGHCGGPGVGPAPRGRGAAPPGGR